MPSGGRPGIRAAVLRAPRHLELERVELRAPGSGEAVVAVEACGVCATNLHGWASPGRALGGAGLPGAHGHEVAGIVTLAGADVRGLAAGDRVCLEPSLACGCGTCEACRSGEAIGCRTKTSLPVWGFADAIVVPERGLMRVPAGLEPRLACLAEPLASAVHGLRHSFTAAVRNGRIDGVHVAVVGAGVIGLLAAAAARRLGAAEVSVVARHPHQAEAARALGADRVLSGDAPDLARTLRRLAPRLVVEAVGAPETLAAAFAAVDRGGEVVVLGLFDGSPGVDVSDAVLRNVRAFYAAGYGARDGVSDFALALDQLAEPVSPLVLLLTHDVPLEHVNEAFALAADRRLGAHRVVVHP